MAESNNFKNARMNLVKSNYDNLQDIQKVSIGFNDSTGKYIERVKELGFRVTAMMLDVSEDVYLRIASSPEMQYLNKYGR